MANQQVVPKVEPTATQTIQQQVIQSPPLQQKIILQSPVQQNQSILATPPQSQPVQQHIQQNVSPTIEQLLQGQPPGTQIKCVTAQVVQMPTGPRIVLQGIQGNDLTVQVRILTHFGP